MGDKIFYASKVSEIVTERILKQLEQGVVPWHKSWKDARPRNWETGRPYNGINLFLLDPGEYLTFKQIQKFGAKLKKGAKGYIVVFWKVDTIEEKTTEEGEEVIEVAEEEQKKEKVKTIYLLRYYHVFNVNDVEGLPKRKDNEQDTATLEEMTYDERIKQALALVKAWNNVVPIRHGNYEPCYSPAADVIYMPLFSNFQGSNKTEEYFATLFHEIVHSTGHKNRLNRIKHSRYGDWHYAQEELVAELGSAFLLNLFGLDVPEAFQNNVAYVSYWMRQLKNDKTMVVKAAGRAERAVEYVLEKTGFKTENLYVQQTAATA